MTFKSKIEKILYSFIFVICIFLAMTFIIVFYMPGTIMDRVIPL